MKSVYISLPGAGAVQAFVEALAGLDGDFDLVDGRYILDARSLMGIFTLDLEKPIRLDIHDDSETTMQALRPFLAKEPQN